ncbi:MAG: ABC transporter ATP-binding protein/permease [Lachnospiraceae bacterium]|nr:ABC transporter ATP-binding protein/permease [Lachnospiraceae bacterium]
MQILKIINRIFDKDVKIKFILLVIAIIIGATIEMVCLALLSPIIAILLDSSTIYTNTYILYLYNLLNFDKVEKFLALLASALAFLYIFRSCYILVLNRIKFNFIGKTKIELSSRLLRKIIRRPYIFHTKHNSAEFQKIIISDVNELSNILNNLCQFLSDIFTSSFILIFLFTQSPVMSFSIVFAAIICLSIYFLVFRTKIKKAGVINRQKNVAMRKSINQALGGIKEIKVMQNEEYFENNYTKNANQYIKAYRRFQFLNSIPKLYIEAFCFGSAFIILAFIFLSGTDATAMLPLLSVFVFAAFRILPAISRVANQLNYFIYYRPSIFAVYSSLFDEYEEPVYTNNQNCQPKSNTNDIEISGITYQYPEAIGNVLEDITLTIPDKSSVAFIGASGTGKTTLADLILGILKPQKGKIFYNGFNIHTNPHEWSKYVGYIPQQIYILDEDIRSNVAFGVNKKEISDDDIWNALELAQLKDFVLSLPEKLDTFVGDRGVRLSGGQRQRIGIARALYRDPPILILDEATSSLDSDTEKAVMEAIQNFQGNKTMIIVAHRLSTIKNCDIVFRIEGKKISKQKLESSNL